MRDKLLHTIKKNLLLKLVYQMNERSWNFAAIVLHTISKITPEFRSLVTNDRLQKLDCNGEIDLEESLRLIKTNHML